MDMNAAVVVSIVDQFSKNGAKFKSTLKSMKGQVRGFASDMKKGMKAELTPRFDAANFDKQMGVLEARVSKSRQKLMGAVGMALALAAPLKMASAFDQSFKGLEKVVDAPISRLKQLRKFALETSALVPIAARELIELMSEAAQGGVPVEELERFSLFAAKSAIAFDMAGAEIGNRFAKLHNVYKLNQKGIEDLADAANHLSNNFAAKASEITNFTNRAAGAAKILHLTAVETEAIGTALIASGIVPETAARGVNAFAARIEKGGKKVEAAFRMIGTSRADFMKAVKQDGAKAFSELFQSLSKSEQGMKALIDLVGTDFADDFAKILGNPELLAKTLVSVGDEAKYAGSVIKEAAAQAAGAEKQWQLLINKIAAAGVQLGDALLPKALAIAESIGNMVTAFSQFADANPQFVSAMTNTVAAILALSIAARVLGFVWAATGKQLFTGMSYFVKMKDGKNVAALAPVMKALKSTLLALPGPLKLIGLAALAAGAAFAFLGDDFKFVRDHMSEDTEGFKHFRDDLFGIEQAADGASGALDKLNKSVLAGKIVEKESKLAKHTATVKEALDDAVDTTLFDAGGDDLSAGGKATFGKSFKSASKKISDGTFAAQDAKALQRQFDDHFAKQAKKLSSLRTELAGEKAKNEAKTFNFGSGRQRGLEAEISKKLESFNRDQALVKKLVDAITSVVKTRDEIAKAKAKLDEVSNEASKPSQSTKPARPEKTVHTVSTARSALKRDQAGRDKLKVQLDKIDAAASNLEKSGSATGDKIEKAKGPQEPRKPKPVEPVSATPAVPDNTVIDQQIGALEDAIKALKPTSDKTAPATVDALAQVTSALSRLKSQNPDDNIRPGHLEALERAITALGSARSSDPADQAALANIRASLASLKTAPKPENVDINIGKITEASKEIVSAGLEAGRQLSKAAATDLQSSAAAIGAQIGRAAAAEIKKATVSVKVAAPHLPAKKKGSANSGGALHDGVD